MQVTQIELSPEARVEIEKHKYFLSEKAGYDVGWEYAEQDWRANFADRSDSAGGPPPPKGLGRFIKRLLARTHHSSDLRD